MVKVQNLEGKIVWTFPKGHIETGEIPADTAQRELMEEAGILGNLLNDAGTVSYDYNGKHYRVAYYLFQFRQE